MTNVGDNDIKTEHGCVWSACSYLNQVYAEVLILWRAGARKDIKNTF